MTELPSEPPRSQRPTGLIGLHDRQQRMEIGRVHIVPLCEDLAEPLRFGHVLLQQSHQVVRHFVCPHARKATSVSGQ